MAISTCYNRGFAPGKLVVRHSPALHHTLMHPHKPEQRPTPTPVTSVLPARRRLLEAAKRLLQLSINLVRPLGIK